MRADEATPRVGGRYGVRSALVVAQVAGALILLIVAGLFVRSLDRAQRQMSASTPIIC